MIFFKLSEYIIKSIQDAKSSKKNDTTRKLFDEVGEMNIIKNIGKISKWAYAGIGKSNTLYVFSNGRWQRADYVKLVKDLKYEFETHCGLNVKREWCMKVIDELVPVKDTEEFELPAERPAGCVQVFFTDHVLTISRKGFKKTPPDWKHFNRVCVATKYDEDTLKNKSCPKKWGEFLQQFTCNDQDLIDYLQELMGLCLTPHFIKAHIFFLYGKRGNNAKSTFLQALKYVVGRKSYVSISIDEINSITVESLDGMLVNAVPETRGGKTIDEGILKSVAGGEERQANPKFRDPYMCYPTATCLFCTNNLPPVTDFSGGWLRRIQVVPCDFFIPKDIDDPFFTDRFKGEIQQITAWALNGLMRHMAKNGEFPSVKRVTEATQKYWREASSVMSFFDELELILDRFAQSDKFSKYLDSEEKYPDAVKLPHMLFEINYHNQFDFETKYMERNQEFYMPAEIVRRMYTTYCKDNGYTPCGQKKFNSDKEMNVKGFREHRSANGTGYCYTPRLKGKELPLMI